MKSIWDCDHCAPSAEVSAGMKAKLPMVSALPEDPRIDIPLKDIVVEIPCDMTFSEALEIVEDAAREYVGSYGAIDIRQYFIEDVIVSSKEVVFIWGS
ncbi:hypothetical protein QRL11_004474 [Vibrio parahaemolyticus]|nr:hypothetical protein [Vibrio parahaemolyticus]